jgi:hypothetical protein
MTDEYETFVGSLKATSIVLFAEHLDDLPSNDVLTIKPEIEEWCNQSFSHPWNVVRYTTMLTDKAEILVIVLDVGCIEDATLFRLRWY